MNLLEILKFVEEYLKKYSFSKPRLEAEKLVSHILNLDRISLYIYHERNLEEKEKDEIKTYLKQMVKENKKFDEVKKEKINYKDGNLEIFNKSIEYLKKCGINTAKLDTEYIFADALKVNRNMLSFNMAREISPENKDKIRKNIVARGKQREPLQYILGEWEFYGLPFKTDKRALIPRADTEILVEQVKNLMQDKNKNKENINILDIGTGSGAISIALAKELENSQIIGLDISQDAIDLANENKELNQVENINFLVSDLFKIFEDDVVEKNKNLVNKFDVIISNPPYISKAEYETLMPEVKKYEPKNALTDLGDGLFFYEKISETSDKYLKDNGFLVYEIGYNQAKEVSNILEKNNFSVLSVIKDYGGNNRVIIAKKKIKEVDEDVHIFN